LNKESAINELENISSIQSYWNEEGGRKWVENIHIIESMIAPISEIMIERISARQGEKVLDIGCGGGITSIRLAGLVAPIGNVVGIDVSEPILQIAKNRAATIDNIQFILNDAGTIPLEPNTFDIITSRFGIMFFDNPILAFRNLHTSLIPNGRLIFMCWRKIHENPLMNEPVKIISELLELKDDAEYADPTIPGPFSLSDPQHLTDLLETAGFNNIKLQKVDENLPLGKLEQAISYSMKMGPAGKILKDATHQIKQEASHAIRQAFKKYSKDNRVNVPSATWIVSATK